MESNPSEYSLKLVRSIGRVSIDRGRRLDLWECILKKGNQLMRLSKSIKTKGNMSKYNANYPKPFKQNQ